MQMHTPVNRSTMPPAGTAIQSPEFADIVSQNPTFTAVASELAHLREVQAVKQFFIYNVAGDIAAHSSDVFHVTIEQGSDFWINFITGSMYSFDDTMEEQVETNPTDFPIPNSLGVRYWAGRGLSCKITDSMAGRELTSGFVGMELLCTPGYGLNFQSVFPLRYLAYRNAKIRLDIRNRESEDSSRSHSFEIALCGYKIYTPQ